MSMGPIDHLTLDAVVAYADGEMPMVSYQRAAAHVARCPQCEAEVRAQTVARSWLRSAQAPAMPTGLLDSLRSIPVALPAADSAGPGGAAGPGDSAGQGGVADRPRPAGFGRPGTPHQRNPHRSRRFRFLGAGALVAGLTVGALVGAEVATEPDSHPDSPLVAHVSPLGGPQVVTAGWGNP